MKRFGQASIGRRAVGVCLCGAALIGVAAFAGSALAERPGLLQLAAVGESPQSAPEPGFGLGSAPLIERIQRALSTAGLYRGLATGRMNRATEDAIRIYQRNAGLPVDGLVTEGLANHIETGRRVDELLRKLQHTRKENVEAARQALLSTPETRDLIGEHRTETADPTRDFAPCQHAPTPACLLAEAAESAKAIAKSELRDWALGELLAAQARAGLTDEARATARRIADPRLIMVALRDIAEGQAAAGRIAEALEAADIIPDAGKKTEALTAIAAIQAHATAAAALTTLDESQTSLARVESPPRRIALMCRIAIVQADAGSRDTAWQTIEKAEASARALAIETDRQAALRNVAAAKAELGDPDEALATLRFIGNGSDVTPILVAAAKAQAEAGDAEGALQTADGIEAGRYKAVVLSRIALAQARSGEAMAALTSLDKATAAAEAIRLPFARDFANSRIALTLAELARTGYPDLFDRSVGQADTVADRRLRAHTLWTITAARQRAGDSGGAEKTRALAEAATRDMKSQLSRVWLLSDIATQHIRNGEVEAAWQVFRQGIAQATEIGNAWGRSRAMSRMAVTLLDLNDPAPTWPERGERP